MNRRDMMNERREEYMQRFFTSEKKIDAGKEDETGKETKAE